MLVYLILFIGTFIGICFGGFLEYNNNGSFEDIVTGCIYGAAAGFVFSILLIVFFGLKG